MSKQRTCPFCGQNLSYERKGQLYSSATSVEVQGVYDGGLFYAHLQTPNPEEPPCGRAWHRWPEGDRLHGTAEPYIAQWNQRVRERELSERTEGNPV